MFSRCDTVSFIQLVGLEAPPRSLFSLFCNGSVQVGWSGYLQIVWQTGGLIKLNWASEWIPLHLITWMVFTFLSGKACTETSPSTGFSAVVNLTGPEHLWDLQSFDWNWLVSTVVIRQVLTHLPASKQAQRVIVRALLHHEIRLKCEADAGALWGNLTNDHSVGETGGST